MKLKLRRRHVAGISLALAAVIATSGAVFAYWTAPGSGSGAAQAATGAASVTVNQTSVMTAMFPGDEPQTLSGTFNNPGPNQVYIPSVTASIGSVTKAGGAPAGVCDATDFTLSDAVVTVGGEIGVGASVGSWSGPTIQFNDKSGTNQDACKGATVTISYSIP